MDALMGMYLNPGNKGFQEILQSEYVDKTGLIALVNQTVGTMAPNVWIQILDKNIFRFSKSSLPTSDKCK